MTSSKIYTAGYAAIDLDISSCGVWDFIFSSKLAASRDPERIALEQGNTGEQISYGELRPLTLRVAYVLRHVLRLQRGDTVAVLSPNTLGFVTLALAAQAAGITVTTVNVAYTAREIGLQISDSQARAVFAGPAQVAAAQEAAKNAALGEENVFVLDSPKETPKSLKSLLSDEKLEPERFTPEQAHEATAFMCYSSGTTGKAKGVQSSHFNVNTNTLQISGTGEAFLSSDTILCFLPIFHLFALTANVLQALYLGSKLVLLPRFDPQLVLDTIERKQINAAYIAPPVAMFLAKDPRVKPEGMKSLRWLLSGAAPLGGEVARAVQDRIGVPTFQGYGLTEMSPAVFMSGPANSREGSVGKLLPNQEAKLVAADGSDADPSVGGEVWLRGPNTMKGYLNRPEETANCIDAQGWFHSGDVATRDEDGFYYIVDRLKDLLKYNGYQVCPSELEAVLIQHDDVRDAAVIGVKKDGNDLPAAFVALKEGATSSSKSETEVLAAIDAWFTSQVASFKRLRAGLFAVKAVPRSAAGKILRKELAIPAAPAALSV